MHVDTTVEYATRMVVEYPVEIFVTVAMGLGVIHHHVVINNLLPAWQVQAIEHYLQSLTIQSGADVVSRYTATECDGVMRSTTIAPHLCMHARHMECGCAFILKFFLIMVRIMPDYQLCNGVF